MIEDYENKQFVNEKKIHDQKSSTRKNVLFIYSRIPFTFRD
jgi:hypothetical protein